jgi:hypothetical protein
LAILPKKQNYPRNKPRRKDRGKLRHSRKKQQEYGPQAQSVKNCYSAKLPFFCLKKSRKRGIFPRG